eukprot:3937790-Rhodomonas_salina.4
MCAKLSGVGVVWCGVQVGREDGSVSLFSTSTPSPIRVWNGFAMGAVVRVCWSPTRPSVCRDPFAFPTSLEHGDEVSVDCALSWVGPDDGSVLQVFIVLDSTSRLYFFTLLDKATDGAITPTAARVLALSAFAKIDCEEFSWAI